MAAFGRLGNRGDPLSVGRVIGMERAGRSPYVPTMAATVQAMIDEGMQLWAFCHVHDCFNRHRFDLVQLRDRIGPGGSTMARDLVPRLRCSRCGGRNAGITCIPRAHNGGESHRKALGDRGEAAPEFSSGRPVREG